MIKSKQEFKNVGLFYIDNEYFALRYNKKDMVIYKSDYTEYFRFQVNLMPTNWLIRTPQDEFIVFDSGRSFFYNNGNLVREVPNTYYFLFSENKKVCCKVDEEDKIVIDNQGKLFYIDYLIGKMIFLDSIYIQEVANKNLMIATSLIDGSELWRLDYNKMIDAENVYGGTFVNFGNKIYLILSSSVKRGLFCIDAKTGKVVDFIPNVYYFLLKDSQNIYVTKEHDIVCKINPETHAMEDWDVRELMKDNGFDGIGDQRSVAMDGIIYFTQTFGAKNAKLGILDINSKELLWKYDFAPECGAIGGIQVSKERIFVHTQDNTLHIFEKE